jgi:hypothetical protein
MSLPDDSQIEPTANDRRTKKEKESRPLRTREDVHVCASSESDSEDEDPHYKFRPRSIPAMCADLSCHNHKLDYISSSSPSDSDTFSSLRRATIRTLSGEQLPRGQTSGPLWFGDPIAGYTIAYVFRLADMHARGRQRYYALLALAGTDTQRAFESCSMIWALFEQIAIHIVRTAEEVASRSAVEDSPPEISHVAPVSSFLTGRAMDPGGYARRGVASVRANGIAELVDNENFFCELHVMFVGMLQELGRLLGGMRVRPLEEVEVTEEQAEGKDLTLEKEEDSHDLPQANSTTSHDLLLPAADVRLNTPITSPSSISTHRRAVAV